MDEVQIRWVGDSAITVDFERAIDLAVSRRIAGMAECVRAANVPGVRDVVPTYAQLAVYFDACTRILTGYGARWRPPWRVGGR